MNNNNEMNKSKINKVNYDYWIPNSDESPRRLIYNIKEIVTIIILQKRFTHIQTPIRVFGVFSIYKENLNFQSFRP